METPTVVSLRLKSGNLLICPSSFLPVTSFGCRPWLPIINKQCFVVELSPGCRPSVRTVWVYKRRFRAQLHTHPAVPSTTSTHKMNRSIISLVALLAFFASVHYSQAAPARPVKGRGSALGAAKGECDCDGASARGIAPFGNRVKRNGGGCGCCGEWPTTNPKAPMYDPLKQYFS